MVYSDTRCCVTMLHNQNASQIALAVYCSAAGPMITRLGVSSKLQSTVLSELAGGGRDVGIHEGERGQINKGV